MAQKKINAQTLLDSIREKDSAHFDAYVFIYSYVYTNLKSLGELDIMGSTNIEVTEDGVSEKEMAIAEKRIALMAKFGEKSDYYLATLEKLREKLSKDDVKRIEQEVELADKTGMSVEAVMANLKKNGK